jgi:aminoglycoside 2'-N-acetyltransferase I
MLQVSTLRVVHTAYLQPNELTQIRDLLDRAFAGQFDDTDWDHALGGLHITVVDDDRIVAHAAVVQRQLVHDDQPVRTGYVEAVAVDLYRRGRGYAAMMMSEAEQLIRAAYDLGALSASGGVDDLYRSRGWLAWQGLTYVLAPTGITRTPDDDDSTFVFPVAGRHRIRTTGMLACDWRDGDVW